MSKIIAERYELLELIGQGGMADVYLAKDIILNRTIAIKISSGYECRKCSGRAEI